MKHVVAIIVMLAVTPVAFAIENSKITNNFGKTDCQAYIKLQAAKKAKEEVKADALSKKAQ